MLMKVFWKSRELHNARNVTPHMLIEGPCTKGKGRFQTMLSFLVVFIGSVVSTLCHPEDCSPPGSSVHGDSPGKNTGVGCLARLKGIFPTQGSRRV